MLKRHRSCFLYRRIYGQCSIHIDFFGLTRRSLSIASAHIRQRVEYLAIDYIVLWVVFDQNR